MRSALVVLVWASGCASAAVAPAGTPSSPRVVPPVATIVPAPRPAADPDAATLPPEVSRVERPRDWKVVALHHSATARGGAAAFDAMHRARGWDGVGYHFVIGNGTDTADGLLETTFRWREQREGAHVKGWNDVAIGICLVGNFEETDPTAAQRRTLATLVRHLRRRFSIPRERVIGHGRLGDTLCPGKRLSVEGVRAESDPGPVAPPR